MLRKYTLLIFIIVLSGIIYGGIIYLSFRKDSVCDELVILNDGSQIEATNVSSHESGMSTIKMCDGQWMDTPTVNIKMVKPIEK
jgi:hypothetical protein